MSLASMNNKIELYDDWLEALKQLIVSKRTSDATHIQTSAKLLSHAIRTQAVGSAALCIASCATLDEESQGWKLLLGVRSIPDSSTAPYPSKSGLQRSCLGAWNQELVLWRDKLQGGDVNAVLPFVEMQASCENNTAKNRCAPTKSKAPPVLSSSRKETGKSKPGAGRPVAKTWGSKDLLESSASMESRKLEPKGLGFRPLCIAALEGRVELASILLASGADPKLPCDTASSPTPLHMAAAGGHSGMARLLCEFGADKSARDGRGLTPLQVAIKTANLDTELLSALDCTHPPCKMMAGWGKDCVLGICPSNDCSERDAATLVRVYKQAAGAWERHVGRKVLIVAARKEDFPDSVHSMIDVAFGEWNRKNGYTRPVVRQNRWPFQRCGAKIYLRKRLAEEVFPRTVEQALVHTACHELGHALGLPHHKDAGELMHFLGLGGEPHTQQRTQNTAPNVRSTCQNDAEKNAPTQQLDARGEASRNRSAEIDLGTRVGSGSTDDVGNEDGVGGSLDFGKDVDFGQDVDFGPACTAAARWLYMPTASKQTLSSGYPLLCLQCYSPSWWDTSTRGGAYLKVDSSEWLSKAKHKNSRRTTETLADGTVRLITVEGSVDGKGDGIDGAVDVMDGDVDGDEDLESDDDDDVVHISSAMGSGVGVEGTQRGEPQLPLGVLRALQTA